MTPVMSARTSPSRPNSTTSDDVEWLDGLGAATGAGSSRDPVEPAREEDAGNPIDPPIRLAGSVRALGVGSGISSLPRTPVNNGLAISPL